MAPDPHELAAHIQDMAAKAATTTSLPAGLTSDQPMPYGYRRWNGAVWPDCQVDAYNRAVAQAIERHRAGYDASALVNGVYNLASSFDRHAKQAR
ncbi:hypothetical protein [Mycolicibacterium mucogenicum]|nr:hypothetical protein [Mycolicibacterium mucogenicum]